MAAYACSRFVSRRVLGDEYAIADSDNAVQDNTQYIPYSSYFSPEKISLTIPSEIKYHDIIHGSRPLQVTSTNWINYVVADAQGNLPSLRTLQHR